MTQKVDFYSLFARIALSVSFLSAVADRFGLWTPILGADGVAWGTMTSFIAYTGFLVPWLPKSLLPALGWFVTIVELAFGLLLLIGYRLKEVSFLSGVLLLIFAVSMFFFSSLKAPFDYSVFTAASCAFLLYGVTQRNSEK